MNFDRCLPQILREEGGYVDNPADPGGATNKGITQRTYSAWLAKHGQADQPVQYITDHEVAVIYREEFWTPAHCEELPWPLCWVHFDSWVQHSPHHAAQFLQVVVGVVPDGVIGPQTLTAAIAEDPIEAATALCKAREDYYREHVLEDPSQEQFLVGWLKRMVQVRAFGGLPPMEST